MMQEHLKEHLERVCSIFGVTPDQPPLRMRGGYVAYVHRIDSTDGTTYFSKTYDAERPITAMIMPTLERISLATQWLARQPMLQQRLVAPLSAATGDVLVRDGQYTTLLFPFIDGVTPREQPLTDTQFTHLVDTVSLLHAIDADIPALATVPRERFAPVWIEDIAPAIDRVDNSNHALYPILCAKSTALHASFRVFRTLANALAAMEHPMVLCHTDIHGYNVVINSDDVPVLIDWEGMTVAPSEHDLLFWTAHERWRLLYDRYRLLHPRHALDTQRLRYYQGRRLFEDLIHDIQRIEGEPLAAVERSTLIASIDAVSSEIMAWGVIDG